MTDIRYPSTARSLDRLQEVRRQVALAWFFAWSDTKARYKRSVLGPFWLVLGTLIGVVGLGFIWSGLLKADPASFIPPLTIGLVLWTLIAGCITGASTVFVRRSSIIKNIQTPAIRLSLELLFQQFINFVHNLVAIALIMLIFPQPVSSVTWLALPGLLLVLVNLWWMVQVIGFFGARFRDFDPLIQAVVPILFFVSPVLYRSHQLGAQEFIMALNPVAYWIDVVREPLQGSAPSTTSWSVNVAMAIFGWALAAWLTRSKASRLAYWV